MKKTVLMLVAFTALFALGAAELSTGMFVQKVRTARRSFTYGKFDGVLQHRRSDRLFSVPVYLGVMFKERTTAQIILDNKDAMFMSIGDKKGQVVQVLQQGSVHNFDMTGLRGTDFVQEFLYFTPVKEHDEQLLSGFVKCRVIDFLSPDEKEIVRAYIAKEYATVLKTEFFKADADEPYRTMEVAGFTQKNGLYYPERINLYGPGWRTRIDFKTADVGEIKTGVVPDVFRKTGENQKTEKE